MKQISSINQISGEIHQSIQADEMMSLIQKIQKAHQLQMQWEKLVFAERIKILQNVIEQISIRQNEIAESEAIEQGLPLQFQIEKNICPTIEYWQKQIDEAIKNPSSSQPTGLIAIISTWQLQFRQIGERLLPALLAGNVVLVKVSSQSISTGRLWDEILTAAGVPAQVVQFLYFHNEELLKLLAAHPGIKGISFVGNSATGKLIAQAALPQMKKLQLSMGTKTSALILSVEQIEFWIDNLVQAMFVGSGQLAWNIHRIYVLDQHREQIIDAIRTRWNEYQPILSIHQVNSYSPRMKASSPEQENKYIKIITEETGKILVQSQDHNHSRYPTPVLVLDLPNCSDLQQNELNLPIVLMTSVKYPHEMIKWVNNNQFAHHCVIYGDPEKIVKIGQQCEVGHVMGNSWLHYFNPIIGHKSSGYGIQDFRWNGEFFSKTKSFSIHR